MAAKMEIQSPDDIPALQVPLKAFGVHPLSDKKYISFFLA